MKEFRRLLGYVWPLRWRVVGIAVCSVLVALLSVVGFGTLAPVITTFFAEEPQNTIIRLGAHGPFARLSDVVNSWGQRFIPWAQVNKVQALALLMGFFTVVTFCKGTAAFFRAYFTGTLAAKVGVDLANDLYDHTLRLSLGSFARRGIADPVTRFTVDVENIVLGVSTIFGKVIQLPITFVFFLFVLLGISVKLTVAVLFIGPVLAVLAAIIGKQVKRAMRNVLAVRSRLVQQLQETFRGIRIVKAFVMEPGERRRFRALNDRLYRQRRRIAAGKAAMSPLMEFLGVLAASVVIVWAGQMVVEKDLEPGTFFVFVASLYNLLQPIRGLANVYNRSQIMLAAAERIFELHDELPSIEERPDARLLAAPREAIRFEDVHFSYDSEEEVLRGVTLEARAGERIALVGASGVGKTTLVNLIPRFYDPTGGRVTIDGVDLREVTLKSLRAQVGLVSQEVLLFDDTVRANIAYGNPGASDEEVEEAARKAHADGFIRTLPHGYDTVIGEEAVTLSGGQRQRLALARAILKDPPIFILDEATSQLDSESEHLIRQALEEFMQGRTTFIVAHRLSTVEHADKIVVMTEGRIADTGSHTELLEKSPLYRNLHQLQFGG